MWIIKVLLFLWPFIKEMVLGDKTLLEALKHNKRKLLIIFIILGSLGLNLFTVPRLVTLSQEYLELQRKVQADHNRGSIKEPATVKPVRELTVSPKTGQKLVNAPSKEPKKPRVIKSPPALIDTAASERYKKLKDDFDKIKEREEEDGAV